jgi:hypothetical protein
VREDVGVNAERLEALFQRVQNGPIHSSWHWLAHNFTLGTDGFTYFAPLTLTALDTVDQVMPGYADEMLTRLEAMGGREKNMDDYAAIIQWLAELVVMLNLARHEWPAAAPDQRFVCLHPRVHDMRDLSCDLGPHHFCMLGHKPKG